MRRTDSTGPVRPRGRPLDAPAFRVATVGVALGFVGLVVAALRRVSGGGRPVDSSSLSYSAGNSYGAQNFSGSTTEESVCNGSHAGGGALPLP